ncbi:hypothetical protein [Actinophytocola sp.]|uniref:hypothetical protein n=1 Tax=Actinophytocola sp. TaxID=1872138 RepID=UPI0025BB8939|nr:hypothetical protein [Actinophytocola sp.]
MLCSDGALGAPGRAPFDRIIATCGIDRVPTDWITQLAPAGAILANVSKGIVLLRDTDTTSARAVSGRFLGGAGFMPLRSDSQHYTPRSPVTDVLHATGGPGPNATDTAADATVAGPDMTTTVITHPQLDREFALAAFLTGLLADRSQLVYTHAGADPTGPVNSYRWLHPATGSWARVDLPNPTNQQPGQLTATVRQAGSRRLWDELQPALHAWHRASRPDLTHWGLTVTDTGHHQLWLDEPTATVANLR